MKATEKELEALFSDVCSYFGYTTEQVLEKSRRRNLVTVRMIFCYMAYELWYSIDREGYEVRAWSLQDIGWFLDQDHATVIHAIKKCKDFLSMGKYKKEINEILEMNPIIYYGMNLRFDELMYDVKPQFEKFR